MTPTSGRQSLNALPSGTVLHDYIIDSELGSGGFSLVYLARHRLHSDWLFAIKEYFPRELVARANDGASMHPVSTDANEAFEDGLRRFRDEAQQLRRFRNERYIVSCVNYFQANGTAYLVMDYDDGLPLSEFLRQREAAGHPFTEADLRAVVEPLLEGLEVVHRGRRPAPGYQAGEYFCTPARRHRRAPGAAGADRFRGGEAELSGEAQPLTRAVHTGVRGVRADIVRG